MHRFFIIAAGAALAFAGAAHAQPLPPPAAPGPNAPVWEPAPFGCCDTASQDGSRVWADAAYLMGWVRGDPLPPLVTTSPIGTPAASAGVLGAQGTTTLFGGGFVNTEVRSGIRADVGYWFDDCRDFGVEAGMFTLESADAAFSAASNGTQIIARPFIDATTGVQASALISFPGVSSGSIQATDSGRNFVGLNADLVGNVMDAPWCRIDAILGYQFLRYDERLAVVDAAQPLTGPFTAGTTITSSDNFAAMNIFNGVDIGVRTRLRYEAFTLELLGKVAAGPVTRSVSILGSQQVSVPGSPTVTNPGGLLALSSNMGFFNTHTLTAAPSFGVQLGWDVSPRIRLFTGYSMLWLLQVERPGDQVDLFVNPGLIPPAMAAAGSPQRPAFLGQQSAVWAQTLSVGAEVKY